VALPLPHLRKLAFAFGALATLAAILVVQTLLGAR
jgi:hypothetical protein